MLSRTVMPCPECGTPCKLMPEGHLDRSPRYVPVRDLSNFVQALQRSHELVDRENDRLRSGYKPRFIAVVAFILGLITAVTLFYIGAPRG